MAAGIPKPRRKLDAAQKEGIADLLAPESRHLLKNVELSGEVKPEDIEVVLYDVYSVDSFAACCVARKFLGPAVHYEGVTRTSCAQHLSLDVEKLEHKVVALLGLSWKCVDIADLRMENYCSVLVMDTHHGVKEEMQNAACDLIFVDEDMGAGVMAWNYFFRQQPAPLILRVIEDAHLGRSAFRDGRALEDGLDMLEPGFIQALKEKKYIKVTSRDSIFQKFADFLEDSQLTRQQIAAAIDAGKLLDSTIFEQAKKATQESRVRTFRYFPTWKCSVAFMRSQFEGRVAESLARDLAKRCKGADNRCFGAVVDFIGTGARVTLRSAAGGPDVSQVARHYEGSGSSTRAFFFVDASEVESMFAKPEIVTRRVAGLDGCLQVEPGDAVTVIYRGERKDATPCDEWSWCYKSLEPEQEGWLPTFSHTLFVAARAEPSGGEGTEKVNEGDLILPLARRGAFLLGSLLPLGRLGADKSLARSWFPCAEGLYKRVQPSSMTVILEEAGFFRLEVAADGYRHG